MLLYTFTVTATDDHCTVPSISIKGFKIKVNPKATDERIYTAVDNAKLKGYKGSSLAAGKLKCGRFAFTAKPPVNFKGTPSYQWSIRDSTAKKELYFSNKKSDTITMKKGGMYIIVHTVNNSFNCPTIYRDTVILPEPPKVIMATTADLRVGAFLKYNGELCQVLESEHRTPGNLRAFYQVKLRVLRTGKLLENRYRSGETIEFVRVERNDYQ